MEIPTARQTKSHPPLHRGALISSPTEHLHISLNDKNPDLHITCKSGFSDYLMGMEIPLIALKSSSREQRHR